MDGSGVVELRRYVLQPGARETLIELFDRELVEAQEAVGLHVLGTFRDLDEPDAFVWLRGFADMGTRARGLHAFYAVGPVWAEHRQAANATMIDSDNVLLLRPVNEESRLALDDTERRPAPGVVSVTVCLLEPGQAEPFAARFAGEVEPVLREAGADVRARFVTEHAENDYPALPVREGVEVFVWLSLFPDEQAQLGHAARVDLAALVGETETLRLSPTSRSLLPDR